MSPWNQKHGAYKGTFITGDTLYAESTYVLEAMNNEFQYCSFW